MKKSLKRITMVIFICIVAITVTGCGKKKKIDLNKYVTVKSEGYNGCGTAEVCFDYDAFQRDYAKKIKIKKKDIYYDIQRRIDEGDLLTDIMLDMYIDVHLNCYTDLRNGDKVSLVWDCDDEAVKKYFGCELKYKNTEFKISGLEKTKEFNPFDYLDVSFTGISYNGNIVIKPNYDKEEMQYIGFSASEEYNLKIGDSVTVYAYYEDSREFISKFGEVLEKTEETYIVENLDQYLEDLNQLPKEASEKMDRQLQDTLMAEFASIPGRKLVNIELLGQYLLVPKYSDENWENDYYSDEDWESDYYSDEDGGNYLYFVYKVSAMNEEKENVDYYWYGYYRNVQLLADGSYAVDINDYMIPDSYTSFEVAGEDEVYYGFEYFESFFDSCIIGSLDDYNYQTNVNMDQEIEGELEYIKDISELSEDLYEKMDIQLKQDLKETFDSWDGEYLHNAELLGAYVVSAKNEMITDKANYVYLMYKVTAANELSGDRDFDYYWYGYFENVLKLPNGRCNVDLRYYSVAREDEVFRYGDRYTYYGYGDFDSMYEQCIVSKIREYQYSTDIDKEMLKTNAEGETKYVSDISEIPEEIYEEMDQNIKDSEKAALADIGIYALEDMELMGCYLLNVKEGVDITPYNYVYFIYKIKTENVESKKVLEYYSYGYYEDVMLLSDGNCVVDFDNVYLRKMIGSEDDFYGGYKKLDSLIEQMIISKIEKYSYTTNLE